MIEAAELEYTSVHAYAEALDALVAKDGAAYEAGIVVVRACFDVGYVNSQPLKPSGYRYPKCTVGDFLPPDCDATKLEALIDSIEAGTDISELTGAAPWTKRDVHITSDSFSPRGQRQPGVQGIVSLGGLQRIGVVPSNPEKDFYEDSMDMVRVLVGSTNHNNWEARFRQVIDLTNPGDVALIRTDGSDPVHHAMRNVRAGQTSPIKRYGVFTG
jgi:hypothetical protein